MTLLGKEFSTEIFSAVGGWFKLTCLQYRSSLSAGVPIRKEQSQLPGIRSYLHINCSFQHDLHIPCACSGQLSVVPQPQDNLLASSRSHRSGYLRVVIVRCYFDVINTSSPFFVYCLSIITPLSYPCTLHRLCLRMRKYDHLVRATREHAPPAPTARLLHEAVNYISRITN